MEQQKSLQQKSFSPSKNLFYMNIARTSNIFSNIQITLLIVGFLFVTSSFLYPLLALFNYAIAFLFTLVSIICSMGTILMKTAFSDIFNSLILFPLDKSEGIFVILSKATPIVSWILISLSVAILVTQTFFNKERSVGRIIAGVLGVIVSIIGFLIKFTV